MITSSISSGFYQIAIVFFIACPVSLLVGDDDFVFSLPQLEDALVNEVKEANASNSGFRLYNWNHVGKLSQAKRLDALGAPMWVEILKRTHDSVSAQFCYLCILRHRADLATHATFELLFSAPQALMVAEASGAESLLKSLTPTPQNLNDFTALMGKDLNTQESRLRLNAIISLLPAGFLDAWWMSQKSAVVAPTQEAVLLLRLAGHKSRGELSDPCVKSVEERLRSLGEVPGFPRAVHVMISEENDKHIEQELRSLLVDDSISDLDFAVAIINHIDLVRKICNENSTVIGETAIRRLKIMRSRI